MVDDAGTAAKETRLWTVLCARYRDAARYSNGVWLNHHENDQVSMLYFSFYFFVLAALLVPPRTARGFCLFRPP